MLKISLGLRNIMLGAALLSTNACASNHVKADQTISLSNAGTEDVYDFQVIYGDFTFPRKPHERLDHGGGGNYTVTIPIPENATVVWTAADKQQHRETVDIRQHVDGKPWFDGSGKLIFEVEGATLRVFLVRELPNFKEERTQIH